MNDLKKKIRKLKEDKQLPREDLLQLITNITPELSDYLFQLSSSVREEYYGKKVYLRGLIEFTNICANDCYYCGIRKSNKDVSRYHLTKEEILTCCARGYELGFRTFVLQGGENPAYNNTVLCDIVSEIHKNHPDCAITLSAGERSKESYHALFDAGADRYLLRHETASDEHYQKLHPPSMNLHTRKQCLTALKEIGFQVGTGFMVGSPYQTPDNIVEDLLFIKEFEPEMIGIGPFIPHEKTPMGTFPAGSLQLTLFLLGLLRLMNPKALIPATTALGTIDSNGREKGILAGANVVMPNLSPIINRKSYSLYNGKISTGEEAAECKEALVKRMKSIGYEVVTERGDSLVQRS